MLKQVEHLVELQSTVCGCSVGAIKDTKFRLECDTLLREELLTVFDEKTEILL